MYTNAYDFHKYAKASLMERFKKYCFFFAQKNADIDLFYLISFKIFNGSELKFKIILKIQFFRNHSILSYEMNIENFYDSIFSQYGDPETPIKSLELPVFSYISQTPKLNTTITEKEEIESLENVSVHLRSEVSTYFAIAKIQEATQHESVRHLITTKFLKCIEQVIEELPQHSFRAKRLSSPSIKKSNSVDSHIGAYLSEEEVGEDNEIRVLLETIPYIYQHSSIEEMNDFNKSLTLLLTAFAPNVENHIKGVSYYPYFKLTVDCVNNIFLLAKKTFIPLESANNLIQNMIITIFRISTDLSIFINSIKSTLSEISPYFGCLIHLVAEGVGLLTEKELIIVQQLFVTLVMSWDDLLTSFPTHSKDLKKIALLIPPMNKFHEATKTTNSLCQLVQFQRTSDNIAIAVNRYFDQITVKEVSSMPQVDALLLLSIAVLEKTRSKAGDFATFFEYFTYDYYPAFTACLKNLITPLFNFFMSHENNNRSVDQRNADIEAVVQRCFRNYDGKNVELAFLIDKISPELFRRYQLSLFSPETVSAFIGSLNNMDENPSQLTNLKRIIRLMIAECLKAAPDFILALLHNYFLDNLDASQDRMPSVYTVISLFPTNVRDKFLVEMLKKATIFGSAKNLTLQQILSIKNPDERVMHLAFHIKKEEDFGLLMIKDASPAALIESWSYVMMTKTLKTNSTVISNKPKMAQKAPSIHYLNSMIKYAKSSNSFLDVIIRELTKSMKMQQGLFSAQYDEKMVNFHKTIFKLLYELVSISSFIPQIHQILPLMKNLIIIESPPALSGLLQLGLFLASVIMNPPISPNFHEIAFNKFILVLMKVIALNAAPTIFRYIRPIDLPYFNRLLGVFTTIFHYSLYSNNNQNKSNISLTSDSYGSSFSLVESPRKKNRIDYSINKQQFCYIPEIQDLKIDFSQSQKIFIKSLQTTKKQQTIKKLLDFLAYLLTQMFALFSTYLLSSKLSNEEITNAAGGQYLKMQFSTAAINELIPTFWSFCPSSIPAFSTILNFPVAEVTKSIRPYFFRSYPYQLAFESHLAHIFVNVKIDDLNLCELLPPAQSIVLLKPEVLAHPTASLYLVKCLDNFELDEILQYIPQLVQSIRFDTNKVLVKFLRRFCRKSCIFQHYLLWNLLYEKCRAINQTDPLPLKLVMLEGKVKLDMNEEEKILYTNEFEMIDQFEKISQVLLPMTPDERKIQLPNELKKIKIPQSSLPNLASPISSSVSLPSLINNSSSFSSSQTSQELYVPSNPNYKIIDINAKESRPLKSAAKVPLLITFTVYNANQKKKREKMNFSCIFKTNDDVRMDAMMIQLIDKFKRIFNDAGIKCYLLPYRVFATGQERGVIECITHAKSRHEIGEMTKEDLLTYFIHTYGQVGTEAFNKAQDNFIQSMAPYSLICYLFQIKDRHNANIMIDDEGHVIHIDFGFIFDISPGNNLNFERAPFKLTQEMVNLMGGSKDAKPFNEFVKLFTKCFIAVRARYDEIEAIASLMVNAGFPCFRKDCFIRLRQRFYMDSHPADIASIVDSLVSDSLKSFTTSGYDFIQKHQNNIFSI